MRNTRKVSKEVWNRWHRMGNYKHLQRLIKRQDDHNSGVPPEVDCSLLEGLMSFYINERSRTDKYTAMEMFLRVLKTEEY